jgi:hypothetical protein
VKAKLTEFQPHRQISCGEFSVWERVMTSTFWMCVGASVLMAWSWWTRRKMKARKVELEARIDDLLTISDSNKHLAQYTAQEPCL